MRTQAKSNLLRICFALAAAGIVLIPACKSATEDKPVPTAPAIVPPPPPTPVAEQPKEKPVYVYSGDRFRDPFVPAGTTGSYQPDAVFDPQKATVKGIVYGPSSKTAVLSVGSSGTYFVKAGRIFDIMGKTIEGFTAKVFADKVVINGEADNVFELKIRNEEEKSL